MNQVIIFPTDTVYGIGTGLMNKEGIKKIYEIKGRDFNKPLAILVSSLDDVKDYAEITEDAVKLTKAFWPGGLTIVLKSKPEYEKITGEATIGIRMPNHPLALELLKKHGAMKTTSVNQSGEEPLNDYETINNQYGHLVDKVYQNNYQSSLKSSTVVNLSTKNCEILRIGDISLEEIKKTLQIT